MQSINRSALVPYTADEMFDLVDDVNAYPQFLPWCSGSRERYRDEDMVEAEVEIHKAAISKTFVTRNYRQRGKVIEMKLVEGPFKHLQGLWKFEALGDAGCRVSLDLHFEFSSKLLSLTVGPVFQQIGNTLVDAFCRRAEAKFGKRI